MSEGNTNEKEAKWYVVHTYSGHENKVKANIEKLVENRKMDDIIFEVAIPMNEVVELKEDGKKKTRFKKIYPGYVIVKMIKNDESWYVVRNTRGVTGFVGPSSTPVPLTNEEVYAMGLEDAKVHKDVHMDIKVGQQARIISGPFKDFVGEVLSYNTSNQMVKMLVNFVGGRDTTIELQYNQIVKLT